MGPDAMVATYPIGLPLAVAAAAGVAGWTIGPDAVMVLHALAGLFLVAWLARACGLPAAAAVLAALLLATSPLYLFMSLTLMSDTPALVWTTAAVLLAWKSRDHPGVGVGGRPRDGGGGARETRQCPGDCRRSRCAWVLPGDAGWRCRRRRSGRRAARHLQPRRLWQRSDDRLRGHEPLLRVGNGFPSLRNYITWLPVLLTPVGVLALGLPLLARRAGRMAVVLTVWAAGFLVFYAVYYFTHEAWWSLRFLLPAFPPLIVGALWVGSAAVQRWLPATRRRRAMAVAGVSRSPCC